MPRTNNNTELSACPFCGSKAKMISFKVPNSNRTWHTIECTKCMRPALTPVTAVNRWNKRKKKRK